jgi:hypothetical protein
LPSNVTLTAPRAWTLALGVPVVLVVIAYCALNYVALVGRDSFRLRETSALVGSKINVSVGSGDITVAPSADRRAHVSGIVRYSLIRPSVTWTTTPDGTSLASHRCWWIDCDDATLTVSVPATESVTASTSSGDVHARDVHGALTLSAASGDLDLERVSGTLVLNDASGDINGTALAAANVSGGNASGDIDLSFTKPPSYVSISDVSGDITVAVPAGVAYRVTASTISGSTNIAVRTNPSARRVIDLNNVSGDITVVPTRR